MSHIYRTGAEAAAALHEKCGGGPGWFAGFTADPRRRLAAMHLVDLEGEQYCWIECATEAAAREAEEILSTTYGYQLGEGLMTSMGNSVFVYAYRITRDTAQDV